jgi:hypothetical protein
MEALQALQITLYSYLVGDGSRLWGNRVKPTEIAASGIEYPYISYFWAGGGREEQAAWLRSARITMTIKGVCGFAENLSDPYSIALEMQGSIADLLVDTGEQDFNPVFPTNAHWRFLTINQGRMIYQAIQLSDTVWSYHAGHQYEFLMEKR